MMKTEEDKELRLEDLFDVEMTLSSNKKKMYLTKINKWKQEGLKALREADKMSYLIPDIDKRKIVDGAIRGAISFVVAKGCALKAIGAALGALSEIDSQYYSNYCAISEKLAYAKYCSEVVESLKDEMLRLEHSPLCLG